MAIVCSLNDDKKIFFYNKRFDSVMQRLGAILVFYKSVLIWSFMINILIILITPYIYITILTKLFLLVLILFLLNKAKTKLLICENLGISQIKLFAILFILDTIMTTSSLSIIKTFTWVYPHLDEPQSLQVKHPSW